MYLCICVHRCACVCVCVLGWRPGYLIAEMKSSFTSESPRQKHATLATSEHAVGSQSTRHARTATHAVNTLIFSSCAPEGSGKPQQTSLNAEQTLGAQALC